MPPGPQASNPHLPMPPLALPALLLALAACGGGEDDALARPVTDTLPGGIPRVMSSGPTGWSGEEGWRLELVQEITGEPGTPGELINPRSVAVDEWGRVYVVDQKPEVIKLFGADGQLIRTIGREGAGPGEFRMGFIAVRGGHLVLHDPMAGRTSVWDTAGTFLRSWTSSCCYWTDIQVDRQGRVYIPSMVRTPEGSPPRGLPYVRWTLEGVVVDTVWVPRDESQARVWTVTTTQGGREVSQMSMSVPLTPRIVSGLNPDGGVVFGWNGGYEVAVSPDGQDTSLVFGREWTPDPVPAERKQAEVDRLVRNMGREIDEATLRQTFRTEEIPGQAPAFLALWVDPAGFRWLLRDPGLDTTRSRLDIFEDTGSFLGGVEITPRLRVAGPIAFGRDQVVVARENADGLPVVARYVIRR